jgi:HSP20 family protein
MIRVDLNQCGFRPWRLAGEVHSQMQEDTMDLKSLIPIGRDTHLARHGNPFVSLQREIDRLFDDFGRGFPSLRATFGDNTLVPVTDVKETDKEFELTAELPGLEEKDVQINVADNVLTIHGEKKAEKEEKDKEGNYRSIERSYGSFYRSFELPAGIDANKIQANLSKGVLKVVVPKPAATQQKKIEVKSAA